MEIDPDNSIMLYVNSNQRTPGGTPQNFYISFDLPSNKVFDRIVCAQASIPKSYYMTTSDQDNLNSFELSEDGGTTWTTITMTAGNYNINSFITNLQTALHSGSVTLGNNNTYTITYPSILTQVDTGKLTYTTTNTANMSAFRFIDNKENGINVQMGFSINDIDTLNKTTYHFSAKTLISNIVINLQPSKSVYIVCSQVNDGNQNILQAVLQQGVPPMNVNYYQLTSPLDVWSKPYVASQNNLFHFVLVDDFLHELNLNGQEWSMQVLLYKRQTLYDMIKKFIQYLTSR